MPKLSIITINYNNLEGLKRTVESVLNQTWQEFEYIVIDGGSTDGSAAYIESQSKYFDYWVSDKDSGIYNAMNKGIRVANGEYLLFLNSGDHFFSDTVLEHNHQYLRNHDLVCFDIINVRENNSNLFSCPSTIQFSQMLYRTIPHQSTFINKQLFNNLGLYDEKLKIVSDWKFFILALFKHNCSYLKVDKTLTVFYIDGISWINDNSIERNQVLKEHFGGFLEEYEDRKKSLKILNTNRFIMLQEIEKSKMGMKLVSVFFRSYIVLFSKKKIKDILKK
ncbi:glycosyltransferase family 2 protein [Flavobacterium sandaracinum]|uniref:Glycosyltransferase n=1 Tax=Flavobacterium sandaracinum TaxID=2541733 RepID=A0A4R5CU98_9FLAO|nr:glycosyltransferase family 2 protein [Flavobacterium sandaracinum]TDE02054.1 glycosyltransferase [Flavobacterium sandaracinum]